MAGHTYTHRHTACGPLAGGVWLAGKGGGGGFHARLEVHPHTTRLPLLCRSYSTANWRAVNKHRLIWSQRAGQLCRVHGTHSSSNTSSAHYVPQSCTSLMFEKSIQILIREEILAYVYFTLTRDYSGANSKVWEPYTLEWVGGARLSTVSEKCGLPFFSLHNSKVFIRDEVTFHSIFDLFIYFTSECNSWNGRYLF